MFFIFSKIAGALSRNSRLFTDDADVKDGINSSQKLLPPCHTLVSVKAKLHHV
jgi:hypothetical protein